MAKKCLIVSYYFPPTGGAGVQRIVKLVKYASRKDWRFTVIAAEEESRFQPPDNSLLAELPQNLKIIRIKASLPGQKVSMLNRLGLFGKPAYWKRWIGAFIHIPDSRKSWNSAAKNRICALLAEDRYDCLMITSPPYSLSSLAAELQDELNIPVILDMRDPWSMHPYKLHPTFLHRKLNKKMEYETISAIRSGIHVCKTVLNSYKSSIPSFDIHNWTNIPNGYDEEDFFNIKSYDLSEKCKFNVAFLGTIHADINSPEYLFRAINYLKKEKYEIAEKIHFHHIGHTSLALDKLVRKYNLTAQVTLWGYRPHKEALEILSAMDAFYQIHHPAYKGSEYIIGGKMYEYLRLKKPILAVVPRNGEVAAIINECNCGEIVDSAKPRAIASALMGIITNKERYTYLNIEKYSREKQAEQFIAVFEKAIKDM